MKKKATKKPATRGKASREKLFEEANGVIASMQLLEDALRAASLLYPKDPSEPGIVLSWLTDKGEFYASIVRYEDTYGKSKQVLCKATGLNVGLAVTALVEEWFTRVEPVMELRRTTFLASSDDEPWED